MIFRCRVFDVVLVCGCCAHSLETSCRVWFGSAQKKLKGAVRAGAMSDMMYVFDICLALWTGCQRLFLKLPDHIEINYQNHLGKQQENANADPKRLQNAPQCGPRRLPGAPQDPLWNRHCLWTPFVIDFDSHLGSILVPI